MSSTTVARVGGTASAVGTSVTTSYSQFPVERDPPPARMDAMAERAGAPNLRMVRRRVLALYYPWYGTPAVSKRWAHQEPPEASGQSMGTHAHFPASGPYDSIDPAAIDRHLAEAHAAGIDTLVCSWWGKDDPTDAAVRAILARAQHRGVSVCIYWERLARARDARAAEEQLVYLLESFGRHPAYLREAGLPVVFIFSRACLGLDSAGWAEVSIAAARRARPGALLIGGGRQQEDALIWDGLHTLDPSHQLVHRSPGEAARVLRETISVPILLCRRTGHVSVATVVPGWDNRKVNTAAGQTVATYVDRRNGRLYSALWEEAIRDCPDWILINSFNQWHAGTEIEPSVEMGDLYLKLTAEWAQRFRDATVGGCACSP